MGVLGRKERHLFLGNLPLFSWGKDYWGRFAYFSAKFRNVLWFSLIHSVYFFCAFVVSCPSSIRNFGMFSSVIMQISVPKEAFPRSEHPPSYRAKAGSGPFGVCLTAPRKPSVAA